MTSSPEGRQEAAVAPSEGLITQAEMVEMFGDTMPIEAAELLWKCPPDWTIGKLRSELLAIALPAPVAAVAPTAWSFELALSHDSATGYYDWAPARVSFTRPNVPAGSIRNLIPLYPALIPAKPAVEVVEALKPFAVMADSWAEDEPDDTVMDYHFDDARITLGDCRAARNALAALQAPATTDAQTEVEK